jgi:ATP-binding protein involved in chromosome partitioning
LFLNPPAGAQRSGRRMSSAKLDEAAVERALSRIAVPSGGDLVSSGRVAGVAIMGGEVFFSIEVAPAEAAAFEPVRLAAEKAVAALGPKAVHASLTAHRKSAAPAPAAPPHRHGARHAHAHDQGQGGRAGIAQVKKIIAVASGKGGVGKSTVAINLAVALGRLGLAVGLLDADIYGPSLPRLAGVHDKPEPTGNDKRLKPLTAHGLSLMSMGFLVPEEAPMIWRGPMVQSALMQMLRDVEWGALDIMVIDMPPGTGDAHLTLAQQVPLSGVVIVSTPQDLALIDARKAIAMFEKVRVPILGLVENMSYFLCPHCGGQSDVFGHGGAREEAVRRGLRFLGEVPLEGAIRDLSDRGLPVAARDDALAAPFQAIAAAVREALEVAAKPAPRLVIEGRETNG